MQLENPRVPLGSRRHLIAQQGNGGVSLNVLVEKKAKCPASALMLPTDTHPCSCRSPLMELGEGLSEDIEGKL